MVSIRVAISALLDHRIASGASRAGEEKSSLPEASPFPGEGFPVTSIEGAIKEKPAVQRPDGRRKPSPLVGEGLDEGYRVLREQVPATPSQS
jgi:hypothetical protein